MRVEFKENDARQHIDLFPSLEDVSHIKFTYYRADELDVATNNALDTDYENTLVEQEFRSINRKIEENVK